METLSTERERLFSRAVTRIVQQDRDNESLLDVCARLFEETRKYKARWEEEKQKRMALEREKRIHELNPQIQLAIQRAESDVVRIQAQLDRADQRREPEQHNTLWTKLQVAKQRLRLAKDGTRR